jgi:hypothetical protein
MSFGQTSGPPASSKQVDYLLALVKKAGHDGFRDARGPLGLTQRQGNGKFTRTEASALIDRLLEESGEGGSGGSGGSGDGGLFGGGGSRGGDLVPTAAERREAEQAEVLRGMPAGLLAAELERRGWAVSRPEPARARA